MIYAKHLKVIKSLTSMVLSQLFLTKNTWIQQIQLHGTVEPRYKEVGYNKTLL